MLDVFFMEVRPLFRSVRYLRACAAPLIRWRERASRDAGEGLMKQAPRSAAGRVEIAVDRLSG